MGSISKLMDKFDELPEDEQHAAEAAQGAAEQSVDSAADDEATQYVDKDALPGDLARAAGLDEEPPPAQAAAPESTTGPQSGPEPAPEPEPIILETTHDPFAAESPQDREDPSRFEPAPPGAIPAALTDDTEPWDASRVDSSVIAFHNRYAAICEQYRSIRARLLSTNPKNRRQVLVITSSVPEEGKSVTSMNLGITMAEGGEQRVLVADCDFRRSSIAKMVGINNEPGLTDVLLGRAHIDDVIRPTPFPNLKLIPAGRVDDRSYGELLASPSIREVLNQLRASFSYCFLDTPPVNTVSDVSMIGPLCDGALMVVEMGRTPSPTVQLAVRSLQTNNVNVLGCVLSRYRDQRKHYYDRYYDYYHRR